MTEGKARQPKRTDVTDLDVDVLIVGAGPVGLTTANFLGLYGIRTLIIDSRESLIDYPRGVGLDDESLRGFQATGLVNQVLQHTVPNQILRFVNGKEPAPRRDRAPCKAVRLAAAQWIRSAPRRCRTPHWAATVPACGGEVVSNPAFLRRQCRPRDCDCRGRRRQDIHHLRAVHARQRRWPQRHQEFDGRDLQRDDLADPLGRRRYQQ